MSNVYGIAQVIFGIVSMLFACSLALTKNTGIHRVLSIATLCMFVFVATSWLLMRIFPKIIVMSGISVPLAAMIIAAFLLYRHFAK